MGELVVCMVSHLITELFFPLFLIFLLNSNLWFQNINLHRNFPCVFIFCRVEILLCHVTNSLFSLIFGLSSKSSVSCYSTFHLTLRSRGIVLLCQNEGKYMFGLPCLILCHFKAPLENTFCRSIHPGPLPSEVIDVATVSDSNWLSQSSITTQ